MASNGESKLIFQQIFLATEKNHGSKHGLEIFQGNAQGRDHDRDAVAPGSVQRATYGRAFRTEQGVRRLLRRSRAMGRNRHRRRRQGVLRRQRSEMAGGGGKKRVRKRGGRR